MGGILMEFITLLKTLSYDISRKLDINTILIYTPKGEMFSIIPKIKGMVDFENSKIKGVILNKVKKIYVSTFEGTN